MSEVLEKVTTNPVIITPTAIQQLWKIRDDQKVPAEYGLRVGVKGGGCSGFSYLLGFDVQKENDQSFEIEGMKILMEKSHGIYLLGMQIDWLDGLENRGFSFTNPNATSTCGCGTSFSA
ncbi:MAG TPA: iron-sulfur cluster assembly accessory protein [Saprospiraceae bacterium]|nr:iron-sulfur cluster assembly accessory protein [Saprospiraceae bacterium]